MRIFCVLLPVLCTGQENDWRHFLETGSIGGYPSYDEANDLLNFFLFQYPQVFQREHIGKSFEGRDIFAYRLFAESSPPLLQLPALLLTSLMHGREPVTLIAALFTIGSLLEDYTSNSTDSVYLLRSRALYVVPFLNPDAYSAGSLAGEFKYRKNRRPGCENDSDMNGVDLNRNFDFHWRESTDPCSLEYSGAYPFSEPETAAIAYFSKAIGVVSAMHLHSYGEILTYPFNWNATARLDPKHETFLNQLQDVLKFKKAGPAWHTLQYMAAGEATDYFYGALGAIAVSPEIGLEADGFTPPTDRAMEIAKDNYARIRYWMFKSGPQLSVASATQGNGAISFTVTNIGLYKSSESTTLVIQQPGCEIRVLSLAGVDGFSHSEAITIERCSTPDFMSTGTVACVVELSMNCRCFDSTGDLGANLVGRISNYIDAPSVCAAAGAPAYSELASPSVSAWLMPMIVGTLAIVAIVLVRITISQVRKPVPSYVELEVNHRGAWVEQSSDRHVLPTS